MSGLYDGVTMSADTAVQPAWAPESSVRAVWVAVGETPEWIATRTDALLKALGAACGVSAWATDKGDRWEGAPDTLADIVRRFAVRDRPTAAEPEGESLPGEGYSFIVSGAGSGVAVELHVAAGADVLADRLPMHNLGIKLRQQVPGGVTSEMGDAVCAAVASTWQPSTLRLADAATNRIARRGGWKIGIGYRTWVCTEVGEVSQVAEGLATTELAGGTLISAPDHWPAEHVVSAMLETLTTNNFDEVPH